MSVQLVWPLVIILLLLLKRPCIGSYYNPLFWTWIVYYLVPFSLLPFSEFSINPLISFSAISIFAISLYCPPPLLMSATKGFSKLNVLSVAAILFLCIVPPIAGAFNLDSTGISDFSERNSAIKSLPLQVIVLALGSLSTSFWSLSRRNVFLLMCSANCGVILFSLLSFGLLSSKGLVITFIMQILTVCYVRSILMCRENQSGGLYWLNKPVKSPIEHLIDFLFFLKIHARIAFVFLLLSLLLSLQLYLLQSYGFYFEALLNRIVLNFDTLIYLSDSLSSYTVDSFNSGFFSIMAVWAKPFIGLLGLNSLYLYKSVPQFIYSLYFGRFYQDSSLGNSNLIAEAVVSSNLFIGCLTAPIIFYTLLLILKRLLRASGSDPFRLSCVLTLMTPYLIFSSTIEFIMKSAVIGVLLACFCLLPSPRVT